MNAQEAVTFGHFSVTNATILAEISTERGCTCQPYVDWFTYMRWQAQGYQVRRGEKGTRLHVIIPITATDDEGTKAIVGKRPMRTSVFCRCQVDRSTS